MNVRVIYLVLALRHDVSLRLVELVHTYGSSYLSKGIASPHQSGMDQHWRSYAKERNHENSKRSIRGPYAFKINL